MALTIEPVDISVPKSVVSFESFPDLELIKSKSSLECVICFLPISSEEELRKCECFSGSYHKDRILQWLVKYKCSCPICMRDGVEIDMRSKDFNGHDLNALLIHAVRTERADLVRFLLKFSADPNQNCAKLSLLNYALVQQFYDVAKALVQDPRTKRHKSLLFAFSRGLGEDALDLLLDSGVNVNYRDTNGKTALMYAVEGCRKWDFGSTPAPEMLTLSNKRVVMKLISNGAKVNAKDAKGQTALMLATHSIELVQLLISKGAIVNAKSSSGETAMSYASGNKDVEDYLLSKGAVKKNKRQYLRRIFKFISPNKGKRLKSALCSSHNLHPC